MQVTFLDAAQLAETLADSQVLDILEGPGASQTFVVEYGGQDMLLVTDWISGMAVAIHPCHSFDHEMGSVHDNAREIMSSC